MLKKKAWGEKKAGRNLQLVGARRRKPKKPAKKKEGKKNVPALQKTKQNKGLEKKMGRNPRLNAFLGIPGGIRELKSKKFIKPKKGTINGIRRTKEVKSKKNQRITSSVPRTKCSKNGDVGGGEGERWVGPEGLASFRLLMSSGGPKLRICGCPQQVGRGDQPKKKVGEVIKKPSQPTHPSGQRH